MKRIAITIFLFSTLSSFAQDVTKADLETAIKPLNEKITSLQSENGNRKKEIKNLQAKLADDSIKIDSLQKQTETNGYAITQASTDLSGKITQTGKASEEKISAVDQSLSKTSLYGIIGVLSAILLSGLLYWLLSKRQKSDKSDVESQLSKTKRSIEEEQILINTKLAELFNGQMEILKNERKGGGVIDHSLPLKVADEIVKMQMNLAHMDNKVKGHRHLSIAVANVFDNFKANGYEIVDHLNKPYNDGMNMQATKEPDPTLKEGEQIIRRIIKPEIHFNNKIIQHAQVIVAYGE